MMSKEFEDMFESFPARAVMNFDKSINGTFIEDPIFVLVGTHGIEYEELVDELDDELHGGFLWPNGSTPSGDMMVDGRVWLMFSEADLVIFTLRHGSRIRARLTLDEVCAGMEIIRRVAPDRDLKSLMTSLARSGHTVSTWPTTIGRWIRQDKFMADRRDSAERHGLRKFTHVARGKNDLGPW